MFSRSGWPLLLAFLLLLAGPVAAEPVEALLAEDLRATLGEAVPPDARVDVVLGVPFAAPVEAVRDLDYDPRTGAVHALVASAGRVYEVSGRAEIVAEVPVPSRRIQSGEVIGEGDLAAIPMPIDRIGDGIIDNRDDLVGMAARRMLTAGRLIARTAVGPPIVVHRNKPVSLRYVDGALELEAKGRALQDGGVGDLVRVMNTGSAAVVTGTVTGPLTVTITP